MNEFWKPVPGFDDYEVSSGGMFRRVTGGQGAVPGRVLTWHRSTSSGYPTIRFTVARKVYTKTVHSLVARAFHGPRPEGLQIRHLDGDKLNCSAENLVYGTGLENGQDKVRHGTSTSCERNPKAKLRLEQVREIRASYRGGVSAKNLARLFGVHVSQIHHIVSGKHWRIEAGGIA